ncbi:hypothetical protein BVC80_9095g28 [Macleaya cordata]|uniref:Uncharacterized protein n=1 Tax=Macleaya cordata TaxID=56857 RepID=A0A200PX98_MACCD|nr:hypothetical protein BVC80_9095g28 [Macleaya cordata]
MKVKNMVTSIVFFLIIIFTSFVSKQPMVGERTSDENQATKSNPNRPRKRWMNHGSFRGPRKHLVNPSNEYPFRVSKLSE